MTMEHFSAVQLLKLLGLYYGYRKMMIAAKMVSAGRGNADICVA